MKSKIVDYICEPNNYRIQITDSTNRIVTITLLIDEKPALYHKYRCKNINYDVGNRLVKNFCNQILEERVNLFDDNDMYVEIVKESLKKVHNRLGLLIWEKSNAIL